LVRAPFAQNTATCRQQLQVSSTDHSVVGWWLPLPAYVPALILHPVSDETT
jgi:hypothetical protein